MEIEEQLQTGFVNRDADRGLLQKYREELSEYYQILETYFNMQPSEVLRSLSAITARLTSMRAALQRSGSAHANGLRTKEVDPLIDACELQYKIHSRLISLSELDWKVAGGQM